MPSAQTYFQLELQRTQFREEPSSSRFEEIQPPSGFMNKSQPQIRRQYGCSPTSDPSSIEDGDESALNRPSTQLLKPARSPRTFEARKTALDDTTVRSDQTPVNWKALLPLFMIRTADAMTYTTIFSFIVEYITTILQNQDHPNGALTSDSDKIGLYAGLAEGSFMLTQAAMAPFWARMADRYGRKRSLILGFAGTVLCAAFVGFGGSVGWVIFWRATFGLNPVPVVVRVMITELTDLSNRPFVFSSYSPVFHCGYIMGHLAGGLLSKPYGRLPAFLGGEIELFQKWPYGLPGIATAIFGVLSLIVGQIWLPETKPVNTNHQMGRTSKERSLRELLVEVVKIPHFLTVLYGFCGVCLVNHELEMRGRELQPELIARLRLPLFPA
ncbi:hypothetical protein I316_00359 [Kwoniella heveanensis BCC8398]|uniref:Major facilitator superfamily (MFS) profile domain-containing protein n=1 Tax=Kwoniella heveanensis BCC8398 TaxID=1296120 RepID=A0A1B9H4D8_9TREE|nr:hypothetical protein I316_00359 [Kwoniella heveanensis BCC8398]